MNRSRAVFLVPLIFSIIPARAQTLRERIEPHLVSALDAGNSFLCVSAASGAPSIAPSSLAALFGTNLASRTEMGSAPYGTNLGGIGLQIVDSAGKSEAMRLLYVSSQQINFLVPSDIAAGTATINIINGTGNVLSGTASIERVAPALFTANATGQGVVAASAFATAIPTTITAPVPVFQCGTAPGSCVSVPIDPGVDRPVTITLYATGLRSRSSDSAVKLTIGSLDVPIQSITADNDQGPLAGVDEVAFGLGLNLRGIGEVDIYLTVDGIQSNHARINIK